MKVSATLARLVASGFIEEAPTRWQITLGVARMWHRIVFRANTVGTSTAHARRPGWRATLLSWRAIRLPFLLSGRAIAPWDLSGLRSHPDFLVRHLLRAHHDGWQFIYDLQILSAQPERLIELREKATAIIDGTDPRADWWRDLVVFEGYHEALLAAVNRVVAGELDPPVGADDPDISLRAYLRWCARQPKTPSQTLRSWRGLQLGST